MTYIRRSVVDPGQPGRVCLTITDKDKLDIVQAWADFLAGKAAA